MKTRIGAIFGILSFALFCLALPACGHGASVSFSSGRGNIDGKHDDIVISGNRILLLDDGHTDLYATLELPRNFFVEIDAGLRNTAVTLVARRFDGGIDLGIATIAYSGGKRPSIPAGEIGRLVASSGNGEGRHISLDATQTTVDTLSASRVGDEIVLTWRERNTGDYDNSGEVGIADITPIAQHYLHTVGTDAEDAIIDGSMSGQVGIEDITPIAQNYLSEILGYNVYRNGTFVPGAGLATVMRPDPDSVAPDSRYPLKYAYPDSPAPQETTTYTYSVKPVHTGGTVGAPSNAVEIEYIVETNPPPTISPPGNINAFEENGRLTISWSAPIEPEVTGYNLYYSESPFAVKTEAVLANAAPLPKFQLAYIFDAPLNVRQYFRLTSVADTVEWGTLESELSAQADAMVEDSEAPPIPILESLQQVGTELKAIWGAVSAPDLVGYRVYYAIDSFVDVADATELTTDPITATEFSFAAPTRIEYFLRVTSVDAAGNESQPSNMRSAFLNEGFWTFTNVTGGMWYPGVESVFFGSDGEYLIAARAKDEFNTRHNITIIDGRTAPPTTFEVSDTLDTFGVIGAIGGPGEVGYVFVIRGDSTSSALTIVNDDNSFAQIMPMEFSYAKIYSGHQDDSGNPVFPIHGIQDYAGWLRWNSAAHEFEFVTAMVDGAPLAIREAMGFEWVSDDRILILAYLESYTVHLYEFDEDGNMTQDIFAPWPISVERPLIVQTKDGITHLYIDDRAAGQGYKVFRENAPGADTYTMTLYDPPYSFIATSQQTISPEGYLSSLFFSSGESLLTWFTESEFIEEDVGVSTSLDVNSGDYVTFDANGIPGFVFMSDTTGLWIARRNAPLG